MSHIRQWKERALFRGESPFFCGCGTTSGLEGLPTRSPSAATTAYIYPLICWLGEAKPPLLSAIWPLPWRRALSNSGRGEGPLEMFRDPPGMLFMNPLLLFTRSLPPLIHYKRSVKFIFKRKAGKNEPLVPHRIGRSSSRRGRTAPAWPSGRSGRSQPKSPWSSHPTGRLPISRCYPWKIHKKWQENFLLAERKWTSKSFVSIILRIKWRLVFARDETTHKSIIFHAAAYC